MNLIDELRRAKIIPAVKEDKQLANAVNAGSGVVFLLKSDILSVGDAVAFCHLKGKKVLVHFDLLEGLSNDEAAVRYLAEKVRPDGIISTKNNVVKIAKQYGLFCVFRVFLIDSHSVQTAFANTVKNKADAVEILPGVITEMIEIFKRETGAEVITGGLIKTKRHIDDALAAGALCCSTSDEELWP